jgi:uncharacterized small protein (DUF1192 family)
MRAAQPQEKLDFGGQRAMIHAMDLDDLFAKRPDDPLSQIGRQDLDPFSVEELEERILILEAEMARVKEKLEGAVHFRSHADALFKK